MARGAELVGLLALASLILVAPDVGANDNTFCTPALTISEVEGGTLVARDRRGDGPGPCDYEGVVRGDGAAIVDYDCTVDYPASWEGPRPDRIDPSVVGGNCGTTGSPITLRTVSMIAGLVSAVALVTVGMVRTGRAGVMR